MKAVRLTGEVAQRKVRTKRVCLVAAKEAMPEEEEMDLPYAS